MVYFCRFIEELSHIDVPCVGRPFTWFNIACTSMRRLDRFFISNNLIEDWKIIG